MMNELQRQTYLSALGVDTYMPRWHLPYAPVSVVCLLPETVAAAEPVISNLAAINFDTMPSEVIVSQTTRQASEGGVTPINSLISDFFATKKVVKLDSPLKKSREETDDNAQSQAQPIAAFSLSVWRPIEGLMIIDSRNTQLALPTDALLKNIFRHLFRNTVPNFREEVLRCPMIENSFAKRTADDARAELQTWLSVQSEIKPINYLWLMGDNAVNYLVADNLDKLWHSSQVADAKIQALILPSLNELLLNPLLKQSLLAALRRYHSP